MTSSCAIWDFRRQIDGAKSTSRFGGRDGCTTFACGEARDLVLGGAAFGLAHLPRCTQVRHQRLLQHAACLDKETPIDRFVRYLHAWVGRELPLQPARDLLRRPLERELLRPTGPHFPRMGKSNCPCNCMTGAVETLSIPRFQNVLTSAPFNQNQEMADALAATKKGY